MDDDGSLYGGKFSSLFGESELKRQKYSGYMIIERDAEDKTGNLSSVLQTKKYYHEQINRLK